MLEKSKSKATTVTPRTQMGPKHDKRTIKRNKHITTYLQQYKSKHYKNN